MLANDTRYLNSFQTINGINVEEFTKINYKYKIDNLEYFPSSGTYYSYIQMGVCNPRFYDYFNLNFKAKYNGDNDLIDDSIINKIITREIDIENVNEVVYPSVILARMANLYYEGSINVYEIWLEK